MLNRDGIRNFRNEDNRRTIYLPGHRLDAEKGSDHLDDIILDSWP